MASISIIIPVYNVERYLSACLDSLATQTWRDMEILLIDDGSSDSSSSICDDYASKDCRFRVFHTPNQGPGAARNFGLEQASSEQICFVDSDDWCEPGFIEAFFQEDNHRYDLIIQGLVKDFSNGLSSITSLRDAVYEEGKISDCFVENGLLEYGGPCCKLFNRSIIQQNDIRFPINYRYGEDTVFFLNYVSKCQCIRCYSKGLYHYVDHSSHSLSGLDHDSIPLLNYVADSNTALKRILLKDYNDELQQDFNRKSIYFVRRAIRNMYYLQYTYSQKVSVINYLRKAVRLSLDRKGIGQTDRLLLLFSAFPPIVQLAVYDLCAAFNLIR